MSAKKWIDENGMEIPASRVTASEKLREKRAEQLLREAEKINASLVRFKEMITSFSDEVFEATMKEKEVDTDTRKGNFTWYSFARNTRIEVSINERIDFDDMLIKAAKETFNNFLKEATGGVEEMIRSLIMDAFSTSKGKLDAKKVMNLVRYRQRVDQGRFPLFHKAVDLIEESIRRPESKVYHRIAKRDESGEYQNIDMNLTTCSK